MGVLKWLKDCLTFAPGNPELAVSDWFEVDFDENGVRMHARPPGREPWEQSFAWADLRRVCFKSEGLGVSDGIYVFTATRPESYVVPVEARGGEAFWREIVERGLFDATLAIEAMGKTNGEVSCWPPEKPEDGKPDDGAGR